MAVEVLANKHWPFDITFIWNGYEFEILRVDCDNRGIRIEAVSNYKRPKKATQTKKAKKAGAKKR